MSLALAWQLPAVPVEVDIPGQFCPKFKWALQDPLLVAYHHGTEHVAYTLSDFLVCDHPLFTADLCLGRDHMLVHRTEIHAEGSIITFSPDWVLEKSYLPRIVMQTQRYENMPNGRSPQSWMLHRFLPLSPLTTHMAAATIGEATQSLTPTIFDGDVPVGSVSSDPVLAQYNRRIASVCVCKGQRVEATISLTLATTSEHTFIPSATILDTASEVNLMRYEFALRMGLDAYAAEVQLLDTAHTCPEPTQVLSQEVIVHYAFGTPAAVATKSCFLVVQHLLDVDTGESCDILLGASQMRVHGAFFDPLTYGLCYRPRWQTHCDAATMARIPCVAEMERSDLARTAVELRASSHRLLMMTRVHRQPRGVLSESAPTADTLSVTRRTPISFGNSLMCSERPYFLATNRPDSDRWADQEDFLDNTLPSWYAEEPQLVLAVERLSAALHTSPGALAHSLLATSQSL